MASGPITLWHIDEETIETVTDFISWAPKSLQMVTVAMKLKMFAPWKKSYDQPRQHMKKQRHNLADKGLSSQSMVFPVVMCGYESWAIKLSAEELMILNCGVGEDSLESLGLQGDPTSPS